MGALVRVCDGMDDRIHVGLNVGIGVTGANEGNGVGESVAAIGATVCRTGGRLVGDLVAGL